MILIGENINIMSQTIGPALRERNPKPIQELARAETQAGIDYLDINIGPARKAGDELMEWVVKVVQEVTDKPLSLDTTNPVAMEAGLKVHKGRALINSVSLQPDRLEVRQLSSYRLPGHSTQRYPGIVSVGSAPIAAWPDQPPPAAPVAER